MKNKNTVQDFFKMKQEGQKISCLTCYDYTMASVLKDTAIDLVLVGDSASNVMAGHDTTLPITLDQMIYHAASVVRAAASYFVVADLPFGTYKTTSKALKNACRMMSQGGVQAIKMEGGKRIAKAVQKITSLGIPVMGHLGLMPQSVHTFGGYSLRASSDQEAKKLIENANILQQAGCFSLVLEKIPSDLAETITKTLSIPTIGIGAGNAVDGQILVLQDMLGMQPDFHPRFLRKYSSIHQEIQGAVNRYIKDVKTLDFPSTSESY